MHSSMSFDLWSSSSLPCIVQASLTLLLLRSSVVQGALGEAHHVDAALTADVALKHLIGTDAQVALLTQVAEEGLDVLDGADVGIGGVGHGRVWAIQRIPSDSHPGPWRAYRWC